MAQSRSCLPCIVWFVAGIVLAAFAAKVIPRMMEIREGALAWLLDWVR